MSKQDKGNTVKAQQHACWLNWNGETVEGLRMNLANKALGSILSAKKQSNNGYSFPTSSKKFGKKKKLERRLCTQIEGLSEDVEENTFEVRFRIHSVSLGEHRRNPAKPNGGATQTTVEVRRRRVEAWRSEERDAR